MALDLYSTHTLNRVVETMFRPNRFLLDTFFPSVSVSETETIYFDTKKGKRRISAFVSPLMQGKLVEDLGYSTESFSPAYIKDKRVFDPSKPYKRRAGEAIGGSMSASARLNAMVAEALSDQLDMLSRRQEVMASEILRTGAVTISGEGYGTQVVDFGRHNDLTVTLSGATAWGAAGVNPIEDIEDWSNTILQMEGAVSTDVVMDIAAWRLFKAGLKQADPNQNLSEILDIRRGNLGASMDTVLAAQIGAQYMGTDGKHRYWVYSDWYVDPADNTEKPVLPAKTVLLGSAGIEGVRHFGAIRDEEAGYQARETFVKSWVEPDPSVRYVMMQSAPLLVPYRKNASLCATVA
jgi:hypothetical protein